MGCMQRLFNGVLFCFFCFFQEALLDGVMACKNIHHTLYVLLCFFTGRSHLAYPRPLVQLKRKKAELALSRRRKAHSPGSHASSSSCTAVERWDSAGDSALSRGNGGREAGSPLMRRTDSFSIAEGGTAPNECWVQRCVRRGHKGELSELLPRTRATPLVSPAYHLCHSESLHHLVSNVIGPIQQPTVSALPTRHTTPQWPPHSSGRPFTRHDDRRGDIGLTTDDYSSTTSGQRHPLRNTGALSGLAHASADARSSNVFQTVSTVVYRRESSKRMQFGRAVGSRMPLQPIASITSHHVLSYQATRQKVLIMDLDETLCFVSTKLSACRYPPTFSEVIPTATGAELFFIWERPHVRLFLSTLAKLFNLALFTSSTRPYADSILRRLDPERVIKRRYYRHHCVQVPRSAFPGAPGQCGAAQSVGGSREAASQDAVSAATDAPQSLGTAAGEDVASDLISTLPRSAAAAAAAAAAANNAKTSDRGEVGNGTTLVKDLRILKVPPELMVMVDNVEECVLANRDNALVLPPFFPPAFAGTADNAATDDVLLSLIPFLESLLVVPDVRSVLRHGRLRWPQRSEK
ncbi:putative CTD nuclear envelope phosphatase 1A-like [Trypanosoma conorhini]|uniref:Mitochondrial import inner membrane translocase subunit TIM50 n=1 Tax=Trypanosoma conorhini TaxID=83891 RepID=A0A422PTE5_9TRYP|nr:putative CTD nuclear envelope phosphatase 1A-like [Trypanosoma conorhini]RNF21000.1 putative CTD nuclear envelope phosphatase 1A-like [Trypanosoma conorhini]